MCVGRLGCRLANLSVLLRARAWSPSSLAEKQEKLGMTVLLGNLVQHRRDQLVRCMEAAGQYMQGQLSPECRAHKAIPGSLYQGP